MKLRQTRRAKRDAISIFLSIAEYDLEAARRFVEKLDKAFLTLAEFPQSGRAMSKDQPDLRSIISDRNIIFYKISPDAITILRVIDGRMDVDAEFKR